MKKPARISDECIDRLQTTADALATEGADLSSIVAALVQVTVTTARKDRKAAVWLDTAASVFMDAAGRAFEHEKKARADRRGKSRKE
jgi:hypothetical protein